MNFQGKIFILHDSCNAATYKYDEKSLKVYVKAVGHKTLYLLMLLIYNCRKIKRSTNFYIAHVGCHYSFCIMYQGHI